MVPHGAITPLKMTKSKSSIFEISKGDLCMHIIFTNPLDESTLEEQTFMLSYNSLTETWIALYQIQHSLLYVQSSYRLVTIHRIPLRF
ncbi:hypothetical protein CDAR_387411 [Caerostris darwini]|uniref:Uncharacterized protein n=1 Tax=Caerostris darwini TaxID=1538125 RepID=A0AAV4MWM1_9ARAC|nr:hypothetical protein CDAR_387411 [Caerostris darwini]